MTARCTRAVLLVKDVAQLSTFYQALLGASVLHSDAEHAALALDGFKLFLHRMPLQPLQAEPASPGQRREQAFLKLWFSVASIPRARAAALAHGGEVDRAPPAWVVEQQKICLGHDPEGNVFQLFEE